MGSMIGGKKMRELSELDEDVDGEISDEENELFNKYPYNSKY